MLSRTTILRSASVLMIAAATGHFMQNGGALASKFTADEPVMPAPAPETALETAMPAPPTVMSEPAVLPVAPSTLPGRVAVLALPEGPEIADDFSQSPFQFACAPEATAVALPSAELAVSLSAPCSGRQSVIISHSGLTFTQETNDKGVLAFTMPALSRHSKVSFRLADGSTQTAQATVTDADDYIRAVVQWRGDAGLSLNAMEFGAAFSSDGHVSPGNPRHPGLARMAGGGYLAELGKVAGADALHAQVYTIPASRFQADGGVDLTVEAEVSEANCGQEIDATAFRSGYGMSGGFITLSLAVPGCEATGEYVVMPDVFADRVIASN